MADGFFWYGDKVAESLLAVKYRGIDKRGEMVGGPMQYIEQDSVGAGMALLFAL